MSDWNYYPRNRALRDIGISNTTDTDLSNHFLKQDQIEATCTSQTCAGDLIKGVAKIVGRTTTLCPDCGHFLVYKKKRKYKNKK